MRKLIVIIVLLLMAGCGGSTETEEIDEPTLVTWHNDIYNITCFGRKGTYRTLSCVPDWMLEPPDVSWSPLFTYGYVANIYQFIDDYRFQWFITMENGNQYLVNLELEIGEYVALVCDPATHKCYVDYHELEDSETEPSHTLFTGRVQEILTEKPNVSYVVVVIKTIDGDTYWIDQAESAAEELSECDYVEYKCVGKTTNACTLFHHLSQACE